MIRNLIVGAFEAFAWLFFVGVIAYATWYGWHIATLGGIGVVETSLVGELIDQPWKGAVAGFVAGTLLAIVGTGLVFTLLDIRAGTDRIAFLMEQELRRRHGDDLDD